MTEATITRNAVRQLISKVADRSMRYRFYHWDWGEAINIEGLLGAYRVTKDTRFARFVTRMVDGWLLHSPDPWYPDHVAPGRVLIELWRDSADWRLLSYAKRMGDFLVNLPRTSSGGFLHRPDLPDLAGFMAVDSMQTDAPFLCSLAHATGLSRWYDAAAEHIGGHISVLQDEKTGLFGHAYDSSGYRGSPVAWGRGNGWAILGLVDTLDLLPNDHAAYAGIQESLRRLAESLSALQDRESGLWHTVLDDPETYVETSASLMIVGALMLAVARRILPDAYESCAKLGWQACWNRIDSDGVVKGVSARTPPRRETARYNAIPTGGAYPWGQGAYLIAAVRYAESCLSDDDHV
jgi:unsaturated rhamnogalacturonyl hydrolase